MPRKVLARAATDGTGKLRESGAFALSCPGNLLLAGEYAVLQEGGLGICLAPEPRAWLAAFPHHPHSPENPASNPVGLRIYAVQTPGEEPRLIHQIERSCPPGQVGQVATGVETGSLPWQTVVADPLVEAVLSVLMDHGGSCSGFPGKEEDTGDHPYAGEKAFFDLSATFGWDLLVDTSAFHDHQGRKLGLGSSAASCLLLTAGLMRLGDQAGLIHPGSRTVPKPGIAMAGPAPVSNSGPDKVPLLPSPEKNTDPHLVPRLAVEAHRLFQGGKGSGYDVWTSWTGGTSVFSGGTTPSARSLPGLAACMPAFRLLKGEKPQKTVSAIRLWNDWRRKEPDQAKRYVDACTARGEAALAARSWKELERILESARDDGIHLGKAIKCPADFVQPGLSEGNPATVSVGPDSLPYPPPGLLKATGAGNENAIAFPPFVPAGPGSGQATLHVSGQGFSVHPVVMASGRAKLTLFGEHTALDGWPACGLGLPEELRLMAVMPSGSVGSPGMPDTGNIPAPDSRLPHSLREALKQLESAPVPGMQNLTGHLLFALGDVPQSGGFGSSAALSLALVRLHASLAGEDLKVEEIWTQANTLDSVFHGKASGMDTGLALKGGFRLLLPAVQTSPSIQDPGLVPPRFSLGPGMSSPGIWLVYGGLRRTGNTRDLVAALRKGLVAESNEGERIRKAYQDLAGIASRACALLAGESASDSQASASPSDKPRGLAKPGPESHKTATFSGFPSPRLSALEALAALAKLTSQAQDCLDQLGLVSPECSQILAMAREHGSLAGKMSGAGGGGAFWCLCTGQDGARQLADWLNTRSGLPHLASPARVTVI